MMMEFSSVRYPKRYPLRFRADRYQLGEDGGVCGIADEAVDKTPGAHREEQNSEFRMQRRRRAGGHGGDPVTRKWING